jgi:predicted alpha/beta superfamily hydrolase
MNRLLGLTLWSLLAAPGLTAGADDASPNQRLTIKSAVLGEERVALVRTPPGYDTNGQRYPVLYMTDGSSHIGHTSATVEFLARNGRMPEMIVVGITNTNRNRDLTPTRGGACDEFLNFIETELIPSVEKNYRTVPFRIHAGHSLGGLLAVHCLVTRPELFNAYIACSPSLWWDGEFEIDKLDQFLKARAELDRTLVLTLANESPRMRAGFDKAKKLLGRQQLKGFVWDSVLMEDEDHGSGVLRGYYFGLKRIFDGWQTKPAIVAGGAAAVDEHFKELSASYKRTILPPELLMNLTAYQMLGAGKTEEAIAAFKENVERYPNSANVYDSLAGAYEKSGKLDQARSNYERAMEVATRNKDANLRRYQTNFERVSKALKGPAKTAG